MLRFDIPETKLLTHTSTIALRWGDMDAMGHVNNTIYFRYLEIVRLDWFTAIGCLPNPDGEGPVIVNAFCNFYRQLEFPGQIVAKHYVCNPGRSSVDTYVTLERADAPGRIDAAGGAKVVWVDFPKQQSKPLPQWLRELVTPATTAAG